MADTEPNPDLERIKAACQQLSEHFDSVHIFANRHEAELEGGTVHLSYGSGNWFARYGQISSWVQAESERTKDGVRNREGANGP